MGDPAEENDRTPNGPNLPNRTAFLSREFLRFLGCASARFCYGSKPFYWQDHSNCRRKGLTALIGPAPGRRGRP